MLAVQKARTWQLQEAKAKLSEVIKNTAEAPQIITVRGENTAIVLSVASYEKLLQKPANLYEIMQRSPLREFDIPLERDSRARPPCPAV